ncbi:hypothetical protein CsSME_00034827 [Camellia sinensis var. sinensis]
MDALLSCLLLLVILAASLFLVSRAKKHNTGSGSSKLPPGTTGWPVGWREHEVCHVRPGEIHKDDGSVLWTGREQVLCSPTTISLSPHGCLSRSKRLWSSLIFAISCMKFSSQMLYAITYR